MNAHNFIKITIILQQTSSYMFQANWAKQLLNIFCMQQSCQKLIVLHVVDSVAHWKLKNIKYEIKNIIYTITGATVPITGMQCNCRSTVWWNKSNKMQQLWRINAIVASCWIYFTIKHDARNHKY